MMRCPSIQTSGERLHESVYTSSLHDSGFMQNMSFEMHMLTSGHPYLHLLFGGSSFSETDCERCLHLIYIARADHFSAYGD